MAMIKLPLLSRRTGMLLSLTSHLTTFPTCICDHPKICTNLVGFSFNNIEYSSEETFPARS